MADHRVAANVARFLASGGGAWAPCGIGSVDAARQREQAIAEMLSMWDDGDVASDDELLVTAHGPVAVRIYRPVVGSSTCGIVYFHGGGWVAGSLDSFDVVARQLARATGAVVLAPQLPLAPEVRHADFLHQAVEIFDDVVRRAEELGVEPVDVGVAGDSTGAHAAAAVARRALGGPAFAVLLYPILDPRATNPSFSTYARGCGIGADDVRWWWREHLGDVRASADLVLPAVGGHHPPTCIITAECDPARDDGEAYAAALADAEVLVRLRRFPGMVHDFVRLPCAHVHAADALQEIAAFVGRAVAHRSLEARSGAQRETLRLNGR